MNKLLAEFLGTFFLCLVAVLSGSVLATAGALAALVYALAYLSGGHLNPAVSVAVWVRGQMDRSEMLRYVGVQFAAAIAASILGALLSSRPEVSPSVGFPWFRALIGETIFMFLVAFVYLHVRTARQQLGNTWFGIAIGGSQIAGASALAHISSGACNPALGLTLVFAGVVPPGMIPLYVIAGLVGGGAAALAYRVLNPND